MPCTRYTSLMICMLDSQLRWVVSSCTGTQRNETLTNCITTPCMDMKTIGILPVHQDNPLRCLGSRPCYIIVLCSEARYLTSSVPLQTVREPLKCWGWSRGGRQPMKAPHLRRRRDTLSRTVLLGL